MNEERTLLLMLKGHISDLPAEQQALIHQYRDQIKQIVDGSDEAMIALSLVAAEIAAKA